MEGPIIPRSSCSPLAWQVDSQNLGLLMEGLGEFAPRAKKGEFKKVVLRMLTVNRRGCCHYPLTSFNGRYSQKQRCKVCGNSGGLREFVAPSPSLLKFPEPLRVYSPGHWEWGPLSVAIWRNGTSSASSGTTRGQRESRDDSVGVCPDRSANTTEIGVDRISGGAGFLAST